MSESSALIDSLRRAAVVAMRAPDPRGVDTWLAEGLPAGKLHELYATDPGDAPAAAGFAAAAAMAARAMPILWLRTEGAERQGGRVHASGLVDLGLSPATLLLGVVKDEAALLRAGADAARCGGLGMLVVESWGRAAGLDLTATRRLMLAAEASGVTIVSLRIGAEPTPSAAATRWGIAAATSRPLAADAPGAPAFTVELLRQRGGPAGARWQVEWNRDERIFVEQTTAAPLSGARLPLAVDRTAARHPRAPLRRAG